MQGHFRAFVPSPAAGIGRAQEIGLDAPRWMPTLAGMDSLSALLACVWMIPGALVGYIVARIFKRDGKLGAAIGALALFTMSFSGTLESVSDIVKSNWHSFTYSESPAPPGEAEE